MDLNLGGKVAIVTGGLQGIGKAIVLALAQEGAQVAVLDLFDVDSPLVTDFHQSVGAFGQKFMYKKTDVTKSQEVKDAVEETLKTLSKIDILINNVGGAQLPLPLEDLEEDEWNRAVDLNLKGTYLCSREVIRHMKTQRNGKIINISSRAGRSPSTLAYLPYSCAKAGVLAFTRQLALEVGSYGINVNAIAPGTIVVERIKKRLEAQPEEFKRKMLENIPLKRTGRPEEIASVAVFLASEKSSYITGATIDLNGGTTMM